MKKTTKVQNGRVGQNARKNTKVGHKPTKRRKYTKKEIYRNRRIVVGIAAVLLLTITFALVNVGVKSLRARSNQHELAETSFDEMITQDISDDILENAKRFEEENAVEEKPSKEIIFSADYDTRVGKLYTITDLDEFNHVIKESGKFRADSVFYTHPEAFLKAQEATGVNALFMVAVCNIESSGGTAWDLIAKDSNNIFSIKANNGNWQRYDSIDDAVMAFAKLISGSDYYWKANNFNVSSIGQVYCVEGHWSDNVNNTIQSCLATLSR